MVRLGSALPLLAGAYSFVSATTIPGAFIFEFEDNQDKAPVLETVKKHGELRMNLDFELFKGVSVQLNDAQNSDVIVDKISSLPAVKNVWPVSLQSLPKTVVHWAANPHGEKSLVSRDNSTADTFSPHVMTQIDKLRAKGFTGKGVHVAVIDTGIDYKHSALGGCFGKGCLVTNGHDFVGDDYTGRTTPVPDNDPMDCQGHGSHVAGIIAANDAKLGFTGGAPGVTLGAYRVFGCTGSVSSDILIAALNRAHADGANIITLSIGGPNGWAENAWAVAASRIVAKGVIITMSAGNEGESGIFYASSGSSGRGVAAIASFQNVVSPTLVYYGNATVDEAESREFGFVYGNRQVFKTTLPVWASSLNTSVADDLCDPLPANTPNLSEYIVLARVGGCSAMFKVLNALGKGARYVMLYNNVDTFPRGAQVPTWIPATLKGVGVTEKKTGEAWIEKLKAGSKVTLTLGSVLDDKLGVQDVPNPTTGGAVSYYSTWGPTWRMEVKPQFGAPGGQILSTYPRAKGSYAVLSGTSMSCPITAAIYALVGQARGTLDPALLQNLLAANANPQVFNDAARFYDALAPVPQQGAGMVQAYDAAFATTLLEPSSLSFNETAFAPRSKSFTLTNQGGGAVTYDISYVPALTAFTMKQGGGVVNTFPGDLSKDSATIRFSKDKVTLGKGEKVTVEVEATAPALDASRLPVWSGYVRVNGTDGTSLSLPYQGLVGSLHDHAVLTRNATWIAQAGDGMLFPVAANTVFHLPRPGSNSTSTNGTQLPTVVFDNVLGSPSMRFYVVPVSSNGTCLGPLGQMESSPHPWNPRGRDDAPWDGKLDNNKYAPEGTYKIVVKALRLYGDEKRRKDWDKSVTQPFAIKYV
ncbi:uncharacterized protein UV8b_04903 [Ustilaginoidea virens]|uniref:Uncharacterized protein n=1 Tax=Ustilaginoidea virens TaxID=1159556 RepID=A0A063BUM1_USTVR|nr:uncharacterized protein UV8b_04903 [Ustilaginoidea virens]QUC20662.1 hypothetical protein UV8b_04903 [Ustilaginoidea virens]GAO15282.1 hypothetical protein UVI_02041060 [Ustilaginoidea virens]